MLSQQFTTLYTIFLSKYIDTGDKLIDSTIVGLLCAIITILVTHMMCEWMKYYNIIVFYLYQMYNDPTDILSNPCIINNFQYESYDKFIYYNNYYKHLNNILDSKDDKLIVKMYKKYIENISAQALRKKSELTFITLDNEKIYPIAISSSGNVIYTELLGNNWLYIRCKSQKDIDYIAPFIITKINNLIATCNVNIEPDEIYVPTSNDNKNNYELKSIGKISKKKKFDTLYYEQKNELIKIIEKFKNGKLYPSHIPIDNKLGILLYGPPGTGKTGTISAIANMLNRSILIINFTNIKTCKQLDEILKPIYYNKYVIVFDEFDCILDVISGSNNELKEDKSPDLSKMLLYTEGEERKAIIECMKQGREYKPDAYIDMAYLLQKLDGLESAEDRIIIATTNNPDNINPALIRPGRFDIKICLTYCTSKMVKEILLNFYKDNENIKSKINEYFKIRNIKDNYFTPLQIINMAIQTDYDSLEAKLLNKLCE